MVRTALCWLVRHLGLWLAVLGPSFAELERRIAVVEQARAQQAQAAEDRATLLSTLTVAGLLALLLLLVVVHQRSRRRAEVAASEAAALPVSEARFRGLVDATRLSLEGLLVLARLGVAFGPGYVIARPGADWPEPAEVACAALEPRSRGGGVDAGDGVISVS